MLQSSTTSPQWAERLGVLERLDQWSFQGRAAVNDGRESWNVKLRWAQHQQQFDIHITAPFGQGAAHLYGDAYLAVIEVPDQPPQAAGSAEELMFRNVGWAVPVSGMKYWLAGRPDPALAMTAQWDEFGRLSQMHQSGWLINYRRYKRVGEVEMPRKIELLNDDLRVKLVIDSWQLDS